MGLFPLVGFLTLLAIISIWFGVRTFIVAPGNEREKITIVRQGLSFVK